MQCSWCSFIEKNCHTKHTTNTTLQRTVNILLSLSSKSYSASSLCFTHGLCRSSALLPTAGPGPRSSRVWEAWSCAWNSGCGGTCPRPCRWSNAASRSLTQWGCCHWRASPVETPGTCTARIHIPSQPYSILPCHCVVPPMTTVMPYKIYHPKLYDAFFTATLYPTIDLYYLTLIV